MVKVDIKRTGFPVTIGTLELWFDSSLENLRRFFDIENIAKKKIKEIRKNAEHKHFPEGIENAEIDENNIDTVDAAFDVTKEYIALQYDIIFGDGTFKKIYEQYPDIVALENALEPLGKAIAERIEKQETERSKEIDKRKQEYLNKKK